MKRQERWGTKMEDRKYKNKNRGETDLCADENGEHTAPKAHFFLSTLCNNSLKIYRARKDVDSMWQS